MRKANELPGSSWLYLFTTRAFSLLSEREKGEARRRDRRAEPSNERADNKLDINACLGSPSFVGKRTSGAGNVESSPPNQVLTRAKGPGQGNVERSRASRQCLARCRKFAAARRNARHEC